MHTQWLDWCEPVRHADRTTCITCGHSWDTNDPTVTGCMDTRVSGSLRHRRLISAVALGVIFVLFAFSIWFITYGRGKPAPVLDPMRLPIQGLMQRQQPPTYTPMPREALPPTLKDVMK